MMKGKIVDVMCVSPMKGGTEHCECGAGIAATSGEKLK